MTATKDTKWTIFEEMAKTWGLDTTEFRDILMTRVMRNRDPSKHKPVTVSEVAAALIVARSYELNPLTNEIQFFTDKWGNLQAVVPIDGWLTIINRQKDFDGLTAEAGYIEVDGADDLDRYTCTIWRKDRGHPTVVTEYLEECERDTDPWRTWPHRMLRHKSIIQCARVAFGLVGIQDEDEFARTIESQTRTADANGAAGYTDAAAAGQPALPEHKEDTTLADVMRQGTGPEEPVPVAAAKKAEDRPLTQAEMDANDARLEGKRPS